MRVLFVPHPMPSHFFPLVALDRRIRDLPDMDSAFLLPSWLHGLGAALGLQVLDIDRDFERRFLAPELRAFGLFSPDVVVDDFSYTTGCSTRLRKLPRTTILRKGVFPGDRPRNPKHRHSGKLEWVMETWPLKALGIPRPAEGSELFRAEMKVIPSVPSVEALPETVGDDPSFVYSGPLLLDDEAVLARRSSFGTELLDEIQASWGATGDELVRLEEVESFLDRHYAKRPIVYLTIGMARHDDLSPVLPGCIATLLDRGAAVVTNVKLDPPLENGVSERFLYSAFLPMHSVCSKASLMIHQCGSGTYGYQLLHRVPAVTLGTMRHDREDVAARLEELGVSIHVPSPAEEEGFAERFSGAIDALLDPASACWADAHAAAEELAEEIRRIRSRFDVREVLERAVGSTSLSERL